MLPLPGRQRRGYQIGASVHRISDNKPSTRRIAYLTLPSLNLAVIGVNHADEGRHA
jgi:hypothetical protein